MSEALDPNQELTSTHGCIRMKNGQLDELVTDYIDPYMTRVTYQNIHVRTSPN